MFGINSASKTRSVFRKTITSLAVSSAMLSTSQVAFANDEAAEEDVEKITVTGSRIKRLDIEGASPVTIIDAEALVNAGFSNVADALRESNLNAFGSWGGGSNNGWASQQTVALKGSSSQHTLVLLDGRRMAKSPVLDGGASNLNTIPMAAVERIEILTDGASAIYGTDAIAGVINIILKKDFEGVQVSARVDRPEAEGADATTASVTGGLSSDKGHLVFTIEHAEYDPIMQADRSYTSPYVKAGGDPGVYQDWVNISPTGRVIKQPAAGGWVWSHPFVGDQSCADVYGENFIGPLDDTDYPGDTLCGYDYTRAAATSVGLTRDNTLIHYTYDITETTEFVARAYWVKTKTNDISAPTPAGISIEKGLPAYTTPEGIELRELHPGAWAGMNFRFDTAGNRHAEHHDTVYDFMFGLKGSEDEFDWDFGVTYNNYVNFTWGTGYLLDGAQDDLIGDWDEDAGEFVGWDPRDPNSEMPLGAAANYNKRMVADYLDISGGVSFTVGELSGGEIGMYVGASYSESSLDSKVDLLAEAGLIKGGNGGSGGEGSREVSSAYFELLLPVLDNLEVSMAGRFDDYSDFGSTFNPQIGIRYNPTENILLRTSFGTAFRAPTLSDLYQGATESYDEITNYILCYESGEDIDSCESTQSPATLYGGNRELDPEESTSVGAGLVWEVTDNFNLSIDYWKLETEQLISDISGSELLQTQAKLLEAAAAAGTTAPDVSTVYPGSEIHMLPNGRVDYLVAPKVNLGENEREGVDLSFNYDIETEFGEFSAGANVSKYITYKYTYLDNGVSIYSENVAGREDRPDVRVNWNLDYSYENHSIHYFSSVISEQKSWVYNEEGNADSGYYMIDQHITHNLSYNYNTPWDGSITLGINNLTDEEPKFKKNGDYEGGLYDIRGRVMYMSFTQNF